MSREKFEKSNLFKYYSDHVKFIEFNGDSYKFNELSKGLSQMQLACMAVSIISINAGWSAWQEQQKKIDKALDFTDSVHDENWQEVISCIKEILK